MSVDSAYVPPKVWVWNKETEGRFSRINRPTAGPTHERELPIGRHPHQLYSLATPNGMKVAIMLEELLALGHQGAEYDAWLVNINEGEQFASGFVDLNPNSKIPALLDLGGNEPISIFESGAILLHLAEKFGELLPSEPRHKCACLSWLFWQVASAPYLGGGFGHFYAYASTKIEYAIDRYALEARRLLDVADRRLANNAYLAGGDYTIADVASWPWLNGLCNENLYGASEFLQVQHYVHIARWLEQIARRPAVQRGRRVNRVWGDKRQQLAERHAASDFDMPPR